MTAHRDRSIDTLRGLAIVTMVAANMAGPVLAEPHPYLLRLYGSFAAPLFILLAGMMVFHTARTRGYGAKHFLVRGVMTVIAGALVDVLVWNIYPFTTVDVLYLIGISLPLAYLFMGFKSWTRWLIISSIILLTPVLQLILGYADYPTEFELGTGAAAVVGHRTAILYHWLIDGWFPIFPWLGFALLGVSLGNLRWPAPPSVSEPDPALSTKKGGRLALAGAAITIVGSIIWRAYPGAQIIREGYSELFYPPTMGYILTAIGIMVVLFYLVDNFAPGILQEPLQALGEAALFMYVLHLTLIRYIIAPFWPSSVLQRFLLIYVLLSTALILIAYGLRDLKVRWTNRPFIIRFLLGG